MFTNEGRYIYYNGQQFAATMMNSVADELELNVDIMQSAERMAEYIVSVLNEFERLKGGA